MPLQAAMGLTEGQQDGIVLEYTLMVAHQRDVMDRHRTVLASLEQLQPASPTLMSNTNGVSHGAGLIISPALLT